MTPGVEGSIVDASPNTGDSAVQAQSSPNKTVKVLSGVAWISVTPTGQAARTVRVPHAGLTSLTIADNTSGSTKYDKILISLDADTLLNPPTNGDFTEATCIITERHNAAGEAVTAANALQLAEITVANGFTTISDANITESRVHAGISGTGLSTSAITLGYAQITSDFTTTTVAGEVDVTGLSTTVTVPAGGRKVKVTAYCPQFKTSAIAGTDLYFRIREGSTILNYSFIDQPVADYCLPVTTFFITTPTAGSHTYKVTVRGEAAGTITVAAKSTQPSFILVELI